MFAGFSAGSSAGIGAGANRPVFDAVFQDVLASTQAIARVRQRPGRQSRDGFGAELTDAAANPDAGLTVVVRLLAPPAMPDDGRLAAATPARGAE